MKKIIETTDAPSPVGPYSQAIEINGTLYISGQIPLDPVSGKMEQEDIALQTKRVMRNLEAILKKADFSWSDVCKCSIFLKNLSQFGIMNDVYAQFFESGNEPARECVEVSQLPKNALVEISLIASK